MVTVHPEKPPSEDGLLGGSWEIVTTYNWAYNPTYTPPLNDLIGVTPNIRRLINNPSYK